MGLCRYLPLPSDRMGILWSLLNIKQSIVLEYGPAGTTHYSMTLLGSLGINQSEQLFTTHMSEDDVVMGDITRLEDSIVELDQNYEPRVIFILASSISSIIGTDLDGICHFIQPKVKAKLIPFVEGGFKGDYRSGLSKVYDVLASQLVEAPVASMKNSSTFNVIGSSVGMYRNKSDLIELERLMKSGFNLNLNTALCFETDVEKLKGMANARLNLVISEEGLNAAKYLKKEYGIPYVYGAPYGYKGTLAWLKDIESCLDQPLNQTLHHEIQDLIKDVSLYRMYHAMLKTRVSAYIYADYNRLIGLKRFLEEEFYLNVDHAICIHSLNGVTEEKTGLEVLKDETVRINRLKTLEKTWILADDISNSLVNETNSTTCISQPALNHPDLCTHMPLLGINGANYLRELFEGYVKSIR